MEILHIEANSDWWFEWRHATGSDFGPAHYACGPRKPEYDERLSKQIEWAKNRGAEIRDARSFRR